MSRMYVFNKHAMMSPEYPLCTMINNAPNSSLTYFFELLLILQFDKLTGICYTKLGIE